MAFSFAYVVSTLLWQAALYDFHPSTLAIPFILVGLAAALRDDRLGLIACSGALLVIRDDLGLIAISLALLGFTRSAHRSLRGSIIGISAAWVVAGQAIGIVVGSPYLWHLYYGRLGPSGGWVLAHPWLSVPRALQSLWRIDVAKVVSIWLLPLAFLSALRPHRLLLAAFWAIPILVASPALGPGGLYLYHFGAVVFPFLVWAAAEAAVLLGRNAARVGQTMVVACSLVIFLLLSPFETWITDRGEHPFAIDAQAIALVPPGEGVTASLGLGAHLSHRVTLLPFPYPFAVQRRLPTSPESARVVSASEAAKIRWIAVDERDSSAGTLEAFFASPYLKAFTLVFQRDGVYVFRRTG
jgi:uncharacterized membrane protein